jgi:hypothetical protein
VSLDELYDCYDRSPCSLQPDLQQLDRHEQHLAWQVLFGLPTRDAEALRTDWRHVGAGPLKIDLEHTTPSPLHASVPIDPVERHRVGGNRCASQPSICLRSVC